VKIIKVRLCTECPYKRKLIVACYNPIVNKTRFDPRPIPDEDVIPDWCPLEDKENET